MIKYTIISLLIVFSFLKGHTQNKLNLQEASNDFAIIQSQNRFVENLNFGTGETNPYNLPIGIKKNIGNIPFTIALSSIKFGKEYGEATLFLKMTIPQKDKVLIFGANNVKITYSGDFVGDVKLSLLSDIPLPLGNMGDIVLKGSFDNKTGRVVSDSYITLECNGNLKELSIDADIVLNKETFRLVDRSEEPVKSRFKTIITDWNDLIIETSFPSFEIIGLNGFIFNLQSATLDFSDIHNPAVFNPDPEYTKEYMQLPDQNLWRGLYVDQFSITFPPQFKDKTSDERIKINASNLIIDENGITGLVEAKDVLPFGDASGWPFSVDDFKLRLLANNIKGFGIGGKINVPISQEDQKIDYEAFIAKDEYLIRASIGKHLNTNMFSLLSSTNMRLENTSYIEMKVIDDRFVPRIVLDGAMELNVEGLDADSIIFKKLSISTAAPFISVETMGYAGEIKLNNFPVTIADIQLTTQNEQISLAFDAKINLMKDKLAAGTRFTLLTEYTKNGFNFKGLTINGIIIKDAEMSGFTLNGELKMEKDNPIYGKYFGGNIDAVFGCLSNDLKVGVTAVFGRKDFRYWYVEGSADIGNKGVPVGPLILNGFTGGVYYRMSATGDKGLKAYAPDSRCSLGLKAGVSYYIGQKNTINGDALFETNFLSSGGIKNMKFYATANFMTTKKYRDNKELEDIHYEALSKSKDPSKSLSQDQPSNQSGSILAEQILPIKPSSENVCAYMTMNYDFPSKVFDADFRLMVNIAGGLLKGNGNNNEAGWVKLHLSPQSWYVHAGTPTNPIGLKMGLGSLSLTTQSYFMFGDALEKAVAPPQDVLTILSMSELEADYMKYSDKVSLGRGVAFGSRFGFDTGDMTFLIMYARFAAGAGFDIMLTDMTGFGCKGSNTQMGTNGWYASGQCYAHLSGELGVKIKLFFIKKRITIIRGATAALLQARLPNPTWIGGRLAVQLNVLGVIKASMKFKISFGNACEIAPLNGDYTPLDFPIISDVSPMLNEEDVDVFTSPQVTFNMTLNEDGFVVEDDEGRAKLYRVSLEAFTIKDEKGNTIEGELKWAKNKESLTFTPKSVLPPNQTIRANVAVNFEESHGKNQWTIVKNDGKLARESKEITFKTGDAPKCIPFRNIEYAYPVINQKNLYINEYNIGYVKLKQSQDYLFPDGFDYSAVLSDGQSEQRVNFSYDKSQMKLSYTIPNLNTDKEYTLKLLASSSTHPSLTKEAATETKSIQDEDGVNYELTYIKKMAEQIVNDGAIDILEYNLKTSKFKTFTEKISSLHTVASDGFVSTNIRTLELRNVNAYEPFDEAEIMGNNYTQLKPLVQVDASLDNDYYQQAMYPLLYSWLPTSKLSITHRNPAELGVPPIKAFPIIDGYYPFILSEEYNPIYSTLIPFVYNLPYEYARDYYELRSSAAGMFSSASEPMKQFINSRFPFIRKESYRARIKYILPGGEKEGTSNEIIYIYK